MTDFIWSITNLKSAKIDGQILAVNYAVKAVSSDNVYAVWHDVVELTGDLIVNYADVTEAIIVQWVKDKLTEFKVNQIQNNLESKIQEKLNPVFVNELPWLPPIELEQAL